MADVEQPKSDKGRAETNHTTDMSSNSFEEKNGTAHPFDPNHYDPLDDDGVEDTTWGEVCRMCCCHTPAAWGKILFKLFWVAFFLYFFILGLEILGDGAQVVTGCAAGALFGDDMNPVSGLMIGIICTVFLQSSSTTTSIIVTLVGAGAISVNQGIYMVMGSNIGTSVTNTIVAMGQMGDGDQLERAFAGATVHDMFNFLSVAILFPLELITGYLNHLTEACVKNAQTGESEKAASPIAIIIGPLVEPFILVNKSVTKEIAQGAVCDDFYPTVCEFPENPTKDTCSTIGLIGCPKDGDKPCPALFQAGATYSDDLMAGLTAFVLGIIILFICLGGLVTVLKKLLLGGSTRVIYKATDINGYLAMILGALITMAVQSSSITTSTLTPLVGLGLIRLEQMFPLTLGANIGTCITSLLAAFVADGTDALQVALAHLFFNMSGILIWYPIPFMRRVPLHMARQMGKATRLWKGFPILYIVMMFVIVPLLLMGVSSLFGQGQSGVIAGSIIVAVLVIAIAGLVYWMNWRNGRWVIGNFLRRRQRHADTCETLPYDIIYVERKIKELQSHTSCQPVLSHTVTNEDPRAYFTKASDHIEHCFNMVDALVEHTGLSPNPELDIDDKDYGRMLHMEKEETPDVDMSGWMKYQLISLGLGLVIVALIIWGIVVLCTKGSTGYNSMGGLIAVVLTIFILLRLYGFFLDNGKSKSQAAYKVKMLRSIAKESYPKTMAQINADLDALALHTDMPALDAENHLPDSTRSAAAGADVTGSKKDDDIINRETEQEISL